MMRVTLLCIGKLKETYLKDGCDEYCKRLSPFCKLTLIELGEEKCCDSPSSAAIAEVIEKEGERIIAKIPNNSYVIPLCIEGKMIASTAFAQKIETIALSGKSAVTFIIGGSFGLSDKVKQLADLQLSISSMTFPHQLARMLLLEQVYRAFSILRNSKYHK